jgi:hypothetical protein
MFRNITEVKHANRALGHHWFVADPTRNYRRETILLGGRYWVESSDNFDGTAREYMAVAADPNGRISYLHGAERFVTLAQARAIIDTIIEGK